MKAEERQMIGIIASEDDLGGKRSVFINSNSAIQYSVKSLMANSNSHDVYTGYMSSFEEDVDFDDDYLPNDEREMKFLENVENKLFVFSYRQSENDFYKMNKVNVVDKPIGFNSEDCRFYSVPVFSSSDDEMVTDWESYKPCHLILIR